MRDHIKQHITGGAFYGTVAAVLRDCTSIINNQPAGDRKELLETQDGRRSVERGDSRHARPLGMVSSKASAGGGKICERLFAEIGSTLKNLGAINANGSGPGVDTL